MFLLGHTKQVWEHVKEKLYLQEAMKRWAEEGGRSRWESGKRHGDGQTDRQDDEERDRDGQTSSEIVDRHGDLPVNQSVNHIHCWPHYSALPQPDAHNTSSVCAWVCVCAHGAINRYSGPTKDPHHHLHPSLSDPCMSDTGALVAPQPPRELTATQDSFWSCDPAGVLTCKDTFQARGVIFGLAVFTIFISTFAPVVAKKPLI